MFRAIRTSQSPEVLCSCSFHVAQPQSAQPLSALMCLLYQPCVKSVKHTQQEICIPSQFFRLLDTQTFYYLCISFCAVANAVTGHFRRQDRERTVSCITRPHHPNSFVLQPHRALSLVYYSQLLHLGLQEHSILNFSQH